MTLGLAEELFFDSFHRRTLERFAHLDHLRLAWIIMRRHGLDSGLPLLRLAIKDFARDDGAANRYHETLTMFWGQIIHHAIQARPDIQDFDKFLNTCTFLADKNLPLRHWTAQSLWSSTARENWLGLDKLALP